jgi:hypothetical protein
MLLVPAKQKQHCTAQAPHHCQSSCCSNTFVPDNRCPKKRQLPTHRAQLQPSHSTSCSSAVSAGLFCAHTTPPAHCGMQLLGFACVRSAPARTCICSHLHLLGPACLLTAPAAQSALQLLSAASAHTGVCSDAGLDTLGNGSQGVTRQGLTHLQQQQQQQQKGTAAAAAAAAAAEGHSSSSSRAQQASSN